MHDYLFDTELVRVAFVLGIVISTLFYDRYGVTTGGAIVPGYLALFVLQPTHIVTTLGIAVLTYLIVQKWLRRRLMLWGRGLFETELVVTLLFQSLLTGVILLLMPTLPEVTLLYGIGFLVPGIIAHDMGRQGVQTTVRAAGSCALLVFAIITLIGALRDIADLPALLSGPTSDNGAAYAYPPEWLLLGVIVSFLCSMALYHGGLFPKDMLSDAVRTGGFVSAAYIALFITSPRDLLFVAASGLITYVIVTKVLMKRAILFGRAKMSTMFLTGLLVSWLIEMLVWRTTGFVVWHGFNAITPTIVSLLANDSQRQGLSRTALGVGISTCLVFTIVSAAYAGYELVFYSGVGMR